MLGFATSAVRDSSNSDSVLDHVQDSTGVKIHVLSGEDEARLTFLAVRRWFGWSAGRLAVFDIGGGSLEIAGGTDEAPDVAWSLPLGAARLARAVLRRCAARRRGDPPAAQADPRGDRPRRRQPAPRRGAGPRRRDVEDVPVAGADLRCRAVGRRPAGAAHAAAGHLTEWIPKLIEIPPEDLADLPGVSPSRTHQIVPGALVAEACMDIFDLTELEICPWALREGVILERLDQISVLA